MLGPCEGGKVHNLHPITSNSSSSSSSSEQQVTAATVYDYVHRYAELRLISVAEESLQVRHSQRHSFSHSSSLSLSPSSQMMRAGVCDVLPTHVLDGVTAEELRLLLCGSPQVDCDALRKITSFVDESSEYLSLILAPDLDRCLLQGRERNW